MRIVIATLVAALALAASPVAARVAVIVQPGGSNGVSARQESFITRVLDRFGIAYDILPRSVAKTEFCRTGQFNMAHPAVVSQAVVSYSVVIHANDDWDTGEDLAGYDPDSMTLTAKLPLVPQIFIGRNNSSNAFQTNSGESTGVAFASFAYQGDLAADVGNSAYLVGSPYRWKFAGYGACLVDTGTVTASGIYSFQVVPGGFRPLVAMSMTTAADTLCNDCDSLVTEITGAGGAVNRGATIDTLLVWVRQNLHSAGKSQNIFVQPGGTLATMDPSLLVMALAYADSLTGGAVFNSQTRTPLQASIHIDDGWRRTGHGVSGGIAIEDSTLLKASIDSLATLRVPFVVGVAVDSLREFTNVDSTWWERARPYVRYTPHVHGGTGTIGVNLSGLYDVFGDRALYKGEACLDASGGQSLYCLLRLSFWHLEKRFPGRVDYVLMPPLDDWTPPAITKVNAGPGTDSLFWVMHRAGAKGVRTNPGGGSTTVMGDVGYQTNPRLIEVKQTPGVSGSETIGWFPLLANAAYMSGGSSGYLGWQLPLAAFIDNFFGSAQYPEWNVQGDGQYGPRHITTIHVQDLSGQAANPVVKRPGWWQIKYAVNRFRAINKLANRTIVEFVYPQDISYNQVTR